MSQIEVVTDREETAFNYKATLDMKTSEVVISRATQIGQEVSWNEEGKGYWSGNHIVYCTAKIENKHVFLVLEDLLKEKTSPTS